VSKEAVETINFSFVVKISFEKTTSTETTAVWRGRVTFVPPPSEVPGREAQIYFEDMNILSRFILKHIERIGSQPVVGQRTSRGSKE